MTEEKPHLSASSICTYTKCGEQYRRRYIEKHILPPGVAMLRGTSLHHCQELNYEQKVFSRKDLPTKMVVEAAVARFEDGIKADGISLNHDEEATGRDMVVGRAKDQTSEMAKALSKLVMKRVQPVEVEVEQKIVMPGDFPDLLGYIDVVDEDCMVRDLKSSSKARSQQDWDADVQMTMYALFYRAKHKKDAAGIVVDQLVDKSAGVEYVPVITRRTDDDFKPLLYRINTVVSGIKAGVFIPAPSGSWWCSPKWCGYYRTCRHVKQSA